MLKTFGKNLLFVFGVLFGLAAIVGFSFLAVAFSGFLEATLGFGWAFTIFVVIVGVGVAGLLTFADWTDQ